jgi:eukaryotic-like serine/threonine-protein kinase
METPQPASESVLQQLEKMLSSQAFAGARRSARLLQFIVEETIAGGSGQLKEYTLGARALGRGDRFDPRTDPIVRAEASRLRSRLALYYGTEGQDDPLLISLPKGTYVPVFETREEASVPVRRQNTSRVLAWKLASAALAATALIILVWAWRVTRPRESKLTRLEVELRSGGSLGSEVGTDVVISPDGGQLAFVAQDANSVAHLYTLRLDEEKVVQLDGTEGARGQFFSPDGKWILFWAHGAVKKVPAAGGPPVTLCQAADLLGGSWSDDAGIVAALDATGRLWHIPPRGGKPALLADVSPLRAAWPQVLPGSGKVLFTSFLSGGAASNIELLSIQDGKRKVVAQGGTFARYLPNGYLTYINGGTLFAVAFDLARSETQGEPVAILKNVAYSPSFGYAQLSASENGTLVYRRSSSQLAISWLDRTGRTEPLLSQPARYLRPSLSPDGERLTYSVAELTGMTSWVFDIQSRKTARLDAAGVGSYGAVWTPDGQSLVFGGPRGMSWQEADGSGHAEPLLTSPAVESPWSFTPDGKRLAYFEFSPATGIDLWTVPIHSEGRKLLTGKPEPFLNTRAMESYPTFSPDGHWLAYSSDESGTWEVYVRPFPQKEPKVQISIGGGRIPYWSPNHHDLFYATDRQRIMRASYIIKNGTFVPASPVAWTDRRLADTGVIAGLDLAPDGRRFAVLLPAEQPDEQQAANHVTILFNFQDEVRRRVAAGR